MVPTTLPILIALLLLQVPGFSSDAGGEEYYGSIRRLEQCAGMEDLPAKIHKMYMNYKGNNVYVMTFNITLDKDIDGALNMKFEVQKCANELGPCEDFVNHTITDLCTNLKTEGSIPYSLFHMAKLDLTCPIKQGTYAADKIEIKIPADLLEVGKYANYWKFKLFLMEAPDNPAFCLYTEGKVAKVSKGKKKRKKGTS